MEINRTGGKSSHYQSEEVKMDQANPKEARGQHNAAVLRMEPPRKKEEWATKEILEEGSYRRIPCGHVVGAAKTEIQEPSLLEKSCGGPMLR